MDAAQEALFGAFPRRVGTPVQHWLYAPEQFDLFFDHAVGESSVYSTIASFNRKCEPVLDKVSIDFDSPMKPDPGEPDWGIDEVEKLKEDSGFADDVLGPVCDDIRTLSERVLDTGRSALGVFTGFGIHYHIFYQPAVNPRPEYRSTVSMLEDKFDLVSVDPKIGKSGDIQRILRVPNAERIQDGHQTDVWTVPLTPGEMEDITPSRLLELSQEPRYGVEPNAGERPEMQVYNDYLFSRDSVPDEIRDMPVNFSDLGDEGLAFVLKDNLKMPCMYERIIQPDPDHEVRRNAAVILFNNGWSVEQVFNLYKRFDWVDWDPGKTEYQLKQIRERGYSDMNCQTIMRRGLCVRMDNPHDCPTYGWSGGQAEWKPA